MINNKEERDKNFEHNDFEYQYIKILKGKLDGWFEKFK